MRLFDCFILIVPFTACCLSTQAQNQMDTNSAFANTEAYYQEKIKDGSFLYTGNEYSAYEPGLKGNPFFRTDTMQNGEIFYDGNLYRNVPLLYDISRQQIVINTYDLSTQLQLLKEKIKYFVLDGHRFENFNGIINDSESIDGVNGFYEIVSTGKAAVMIKRQKILKNGEKSDNPNFRSAPNFFIENDVFFMKNGNKIFLVTGKNELLNALEDKKSAIKIFIRNHHFRFKKNIEKELVTTAAYYSSLK